MPAPFFVFRDAGVGNRGVGILGGIWGFRDAGRCSGFRGQVCRSGDAGERLAGKGGSAFGGLPGARKTAGHSEDCRTLGGRERGLWGLVRVSGAACKRMGGELSGIAGGGRRWLRIAGCAGTGCRALGCWEEGRLGVGRGMLGGDLFGRNLVGCREGAARAACCWLFGNRVEAGRGCSGLCREPKPRESGV